MDEVDRKLINLVQDEIPITERPFAACGARLGLDEGEVLRRLRATQEMGLFRRLGASLDPRKLGYASTLVAARVPEDKMKAAVDFINRYAEVTHNYERDDDFNVWFTLIARAEGAIERIVEEIRQHPAVEELLNLPATRVFKTRVWFDLEQAGQRR